MPPSRSPDASPPSHEVSPLHLSQLRVGGELTSRSSLATGISSSAPRDAFSKYTFPAMSPTMTEGGIAEWKKQVGDSFTAGDVVFEIVRCAFLSFSSCYSFSSLPSRLVLLRAVLYRLNPAEQTN